MIVFYSSQVDLPPCHDLPHFYQSPITFSLHLPEPSSWDHLATPRSFPFICICCLPPSRLPPPDVVLPDVIIFLGDMTFIFSPIFDSWKCERVSDIEFTNRLHIHKEYPRELGVTCQEFRHRRQHFNYRTILQTSLPPLQGSRPFPLIQGDPL